MKNDGTPRWAADSTARASVVGMTLRELNGKLFNPLFTAVGEIGPGSGLGRVRSRHPESTVRLQVGMQVIHPDRLNGWCGEALLNVAADCIRHA